MTPRRRESSDEISYVTPRCLVEESALTPAGEERITPTFSPLVSFRRKGRSVKKDHQQPLTRFSQTPKKEASLITDSPSVNDLPKKTDSSIVNDSRRINDSSNINDSLLNSSQSKIPGPLTRSKSCERKKQNVSNIAAVKHSKSGEIRRSHLVQSQRKTSIPGPLITSPTIKQPSQTSEKEAQSQTPCLSKTPRSLLNNPTSATARKVLKSKSTDGLQQHLVRNSIATASARDRTKSGDVAVQNKLSVQKTPKNKSGLVRSHSSDATKQHRVTASQKKVEEVVMKPDLENLNARKSNSRGSFAEWLKKRRNEK